MDYHKVVPITKLVADFPPTMCPVGLETLIKALQQEIIKGNINVKISVDGECRDIQCIGYGKDMNGEDTIVIFDRPDTLSKESSTTIEKENLYAYQYCRRTEEIY